jgi:hypothetical protein
MMMPRYCLGIAFATLAACVSAEKKPGARLLAPFGGVKPPSQLLDAFSGLPPSAPSRRLPIPRLILSSSVLPRLRLRRALPMVDGGAVRVTLGLDGSAQMDITARDPIIGGQLEINSGGRLGWRKLWLFPGLTDAATRVDVGVSTDEGVVLKLGLMSRDRAKGLRLVHRVPVPSGFMPSNTSCSIDVGATLQVPAELKLGSGSGLRALGEAAQVEADLDCLDLCVEL